MSRVKNPRVLLAAGIVVVTAALAVVLLPGAGGDNEPERDSSPARTVEPLRVVRAELTLEQTRRADTGKLELLVSLPGPQLNTLTLTGGEPLVQLSCLDRGGEMTVRQPIDWPLVEEPGYPPHIHQPADRRLLDGIRSCRLAGPGMDFEGHVSGRLPVAE